MNKIMYCESCDSYTLSETCNCGKKSVLRKPPRYSPDDKMGKYRRQARKKELIERGLL